MYIVLGTVTEIYWMSTVQPTYYAKLLIFFYIWRIMNNCHEYDK